MLKLCIISGFKTLNFKFIFSQGGRQPVQPVVGLELVLPTHPSLVVLLPHLLRMSVSQVLGRGPHLLPLLLQSLEVTKIVEEEHLDRLGQIQVAVFLEPVLVQF